MTARFGTWDRLLIRLSVSPSLRYSVLGSLPALTKGSTATDEISCPALRPRHKKAAGKASASTATPATEPHSTFRVRPLAGGSPATTSTLVELELRRKRFRSASISPALW